MKSNPWYIFVFLAITFAAGFATLRAEQITGLILYMDPPVGSMKIAETISFISIERKSVAYSDVLLANGQRREIQNAGILSILQHQPPDLESLLALEQKARTAASKYPNVRPSVENFMSKVRLAQQQAMKHEQISVPTAPRAQLPSSLSVGGVTYVSVSLAGVDGDTAKIFHSEGIANLPLALLTKAQIAFLNTTSSTVRVDDDWAAKKKLADAARAKRIEDEAKRVIEMAAIKRRELITKGRQMEEAARFDEALANFTEANSESDVQRVALAMAADFETRKDYESAAEYFEKAGLFSEAGRVRKTYSMTESASVGRLSSEEIFRKCAPATVSIVAEDRQGVGVGSGFFVRKGGYIMTNHHVVEGARAISVVVEKDVYPAEVVARSKTPDLAIVKIALADHPVLEFSDSERVKPGAQAFAIGTPKSLPKSITGGMISATDRKKYGNEVFQMSVLINHGNSGGPVLDERGRVIGISTFGEGTAAVVDGVAIGSDVQGINYAIKSNEAKALLNRIPR